MPAEKKFVDREGYGIIAPGKPDFGRVLTVLHRKEPDRIPVMELGIDNRIMESFLGKSVTNVEDELLFWFQGGYDYIQRRPNYEFPNISLNAAVGTALRMQYQNSEEAAEHFSEQSDRALIETEEDFDLFSWIDPASVDFSDILYLNKNMPGGMKIISGVGGIFTRAWNIMGFENFCMKVLDKDELVRRVMDTIAEIQMKVLERILDIKEVGAIWYGDDLAYTEATMLAPQFYREYLFPHMKKMAEMAHQKGLPYIFHSDGDLINLMDDLINFVKIDALHPWEPKAMDIVEGKKNFGKEIAIIGNIDLSYTLPFGSEKEVENEVIERIRDCGPGGGYAISSSNTLTRNIPVENFRTMINTVMEYGKYPLINEW